MASLSPDDHGRLLVTAATAPASAPLTVVRTAELLSVPRGSRRGATALPAAGRDFDADAGFRDFAAAGFFDPDRAVVDFFAPDFFAFAPDAFAPARFAAGLAPDRLGAPDAVRFVGLVFRAAAGFGLDRSPPAPAVFFRVGRFATCPPV